MMNSLWNARSTVCKVLIGIFVNISNICLLYRLSCDSIRFEYHPVSCSVSISFKHRLAGQNIYYLCTAIYICLNFLWGIRCNQVLTLLQLSHCHPIFSFVSFFQISQPIRLKRAHPSHWPPHKVSYKESYLLRRQRAR
jgi:hypothetical protein